MKFSILIRLLCGIGFSVFLMATALHASLEDILAPLPVTPVTSVSDSNIRSPQPVEGMRSQGSLQSQYTPRALPANAILTSDIQEAITKEVEATLRPASRLTLVPLRDLPDLSTYSQPFHVNVMNMPGRLQRGSVLVSFQIENEKGVLGEWSVPFRVHLFAEAWSPRSQLRRGELASASDFEIRQVDLLVEPDAVPAQLENLLRHEYSRDVRPGNPLVWGDLIERSLVRKGDVVEVSAVDGLLAITMRAVARQDGSDGDLILLRNIDSAKEFSARVVGENRVEVIF